MVRNYLKNKFLPRYCEKTFLSCHNEDFSKDKFTFNADIVMASRRSRLKAIANLPVRRKPVSAQPESDNSQNLKTEEDKTDVSSLETEEKEQEIKKCEDSDNAKKQDSNQDANSDVCTQAEPELISPEVPSTENCVPKTIKSPPPASRFGRRIKPSVSLSFLKDRPPRERIDESSKNSEKSPVNEDHPTVGSVNNLKSPESESNKSATELKKPTEDVSSTTTSKISQTDAVPQSEGAEKVGEVNVTVEREHASQPQPQTHVNNEQQSRSEDTSGFNFKVPVNNVRHNIFVNDSGPQATEDATVNKRNDESQSQNSSVDNSVSEPAPLNSSQMQCNLTGVRRQWTNFKPKKAKYNDFAKKVADARREFHRKYEKIPPDRSSLRMIDLIFYNPSTNPMESKSKAERRDSVRSDEDLLNEGRVDDPEPVDRTSESNYDKNSKSEEYGRLPVPQVKIGLNGEIILDEKSLVIETTNAKKGREDLQNSVPIYEDRNSRTCYYKRKTQKSRDWSNIETKRFYKALNTIGTDFSLMQKYFPTRSRLELKNKFKREEKFNRVLIDKVLNNPSEFDITQFEKYLAAEKQMVQESTEKKADRKGKPKKTENKSRGKSSILSKEITESDENDAGLDSSQRRTNERMRVNEKSKQINEINLLCEKYSLRGVGESPSVQQSSPAVIFEENANDFNSSSRVFTSVGVNELNNANKIRDALDEIQTFNYPGSEVSRKEVLVDSIDGTEKLDDCGEVRDNTTGPVDEFYQAVVSLSASLKSDECKNMKSNRVGKRVRSNGTKNVPEKKKVNQTGRKIAKKTEEDDYPFMSTLDIETYESECDNYSSSNESNDNSSIISTKTITDQDFINLLAANAKNMKESKIQFQITEGCSLEKNVEIILDNVPSITLNALNEI